MHELVYGDHLRCAAWQRQHLGGRGEFGETALHKAATAGHVEAVKTLLQLSADIPVWTCIEDVHDPTVFTNTVPCASWPYTSSLPDDLPHIIFKPYILPHRYVIFKPSSSDVDGGPAGADESSGVG